MWCKQRCRAQTGCQGVLGEAGRSMWARPPSWSSFMSQDRVEHRGVPRCCVLTLVTPGFPVSLPRNLSPFTPTVSRKTGSRVSRMFSMSHKSPPPKVPQPNRLDEVYEALKKGLT